MAESFQERVVLLLRMLTVRKVKRLALCSGTVILVLLVLRIYNKLPARGAITSSITCKAKLSQIVFPDELERLRFLSGIHKDPLAVEADYFNMLATLQQQCFDQEHIGPTEDGGWEVCMDRQYRLKKPCLVYSFGIGNDFRFEHGVEEKMGCEVHAFDPSMGVKSHQYSEKGYFYNIGLDSANHMTARGGWTMRTLQRIMQDLGHEGRTIDYLKMDIEFAEWPALHNIIKTGLINQVRQLALETHTPEMDIHVAPEHKCTWSNVDTMAFMLKTLMELQRAGFNIYYTRTNYRTEYVSKLTDQKRYCCHNIHLVNLKHPQNAWQPP